MLFAPVADGNNNAANPIINTRSFGERPQRVGELAAARDKMLLKVLAAKAELRAAKAAPDQGGSGGGGGGGGSRL